MSTVRRVFKNTAVLLVSQLVTTGLSIVLLILAARYLGDVVYGKLGFALGLSGLFGPVADLGLSVLTIREVARNKELVKKYLGNILVIKVLLSLVTFALLFLVINLMHYSADTTLAVYLLGVSVILGSFSQLFRSIFRAFEKMEYEALINVLKSFVTVSLGILVLLLGYGLIGLALVYVLAELISLLVSLAITVRKFARPAIEVALEFWKSSVASALPFCLTTIIGVIFFRIDVVMLSVMKGDQAAGLYTAATNIIITLLVIADAFMFAVFPVMSRYFVDSRDTLKMALQKSVKYLVILALPIAAGTYLLADRIVSLVYGKEYAGAAIVLQVLAFYLPLKFVSLATGWTLSSINREPRRSFSAAIAVTANVILNWALIPPWGMFGAALASVLAQVVILSLYLYFVAGYLQGLALHKVIVRPLIACLVMAALVFYLREFNLFLLIPASAILYFGIIYMLGTLTTDDKQAFRELAGNYQPNRAKTESADDNLRVQ